jgi:hypothetical protein
MVFVPFCIWVAALVRHRGWWADGEVLVNVASRGFIPCTITTPCPIAVPLKLSQKFVLPSAGLPRFNTKPAVLAIREITRVCVGYFRAVELIHQAKIRPQILG